MLLVAAALFAMLLRSASVTAQSASDSLAKELMFNYSQTTGDSAMAGYQTNVYIKHLYQTLQRNFTLWAVPSMYAIARGQRAFVSEEYSRLTFKGNGEYENRRQVYYTTIPHNRRTMPTLLREVLEKQ